jgi:sulfite reductase (NADPH) hemoprotein beta-component
MLRVKIPQGILDARSCAPGDGGRGYSRGFGHITTGRTCQLHFLKLTTSRAAMRRLATAGLTTREACGNSVRNITSCPYAGVAADEAFDVTPYAEALTRHLLRHPLSSTLPRKFKIAFEGCARDHAVTAINDMAGAPACRGTTARAPRLPRDGRRRHVDPVRSGWLLFDFLPAGEILDVADALLRVFHRLGDYKHKQRNRLKFLIRDMGWPAWRAEFERELEAVRSEGGCRCLSIRTPLRRRRRRTGRAAGPHRRRSRAASRAQARCMGPAHARASAHGTRVERGARALGADQRPGPKQTPSRS